jgi:hypothetical protein
MSKFFKAICLKEIFWNNRTYKQGQTINIDEGDAKTLADANVIGDVVQIELTKPIEFAIQEEQENAMQPYKKRGRRPV